MALALIEAAGGALAVTSANRSGSPAPATAAEALADLEGRVAVVIDGGACPGGIASAVVDLVGRPPRLLRSGGIALGALREVLPDLVERPSPPEGCRPTFGR
jgi:L-threonylcarbamoyladenylate synthase